MNKYDLGINRVKLGDAMKLEKRFNQYLANISVMIMKLHNIHWNVKGMAFVQVHEFTEQKYDEFFEKLDVIAELFQMYDHIPVSTLKEQLEIATIKEEPTRKFSDKEAIEIVLKDFEQMRKEATELRNAADDENWFSAVAILEEHVDDYNKQIWFMKSMLA